MWFLTWLLPALFFGVLLLFAADHWMHAPRSRRPLDYVVGAARIDRFNELLYRVPYAGPVAAMLFCLLEWFLCLMLIFAVLILLGLAGWRLFAPS